MTVHNTLKRLGYRRKKNLHASEQKRRDIALERFVSIDESGAKTNLTRL